MSASIVIRPLGPTAALSVANTQHAAVAITNPGQDITNFAAFTNVGATDICVIILPLTSTGTAPVAPTLVFPVDGTPTIPTSFILPHSMTSPIILAVPNSNNGFAVSAIGSAAGPSIMYITPVGDQS